MSITTVPCCQALGRRGPIILLAMLATLVGCSESAPPAGTGIPAELPPAAAASEVSPPAPLRDTGLLIAEANAALARDRMFSPPGDNALELLLEIVAVEPEHRRARAGLADIQPFVLIGLEQRLATGDLAEAERLFELFRRADETHPALGRLRAQLDLAQAQQTRVESERLAVQAESVRLTSAAAAPQTAVAPTESFVAVQDPLPAASPSVAQAPDRAPESAPAAVDRPPAPDFVALPPPAAPAPIGSSVLPPILAQFAPRYPTQAQRRRLEGLVEVEFTVAGNGSVSDVRVLRSEPPGVFDREAIGAMQRWRFEGTGQDVVGRRVFDFKLEEG